MQRTPQLRKLQLGDYDRPRPRAIEEVWRPSLEWIAVVEAQEAERFQKAEKQARETSRLRKEMEQAEEAARRVDMDQEDTVE